MCRGTKCNYKYTTSRAGASQGPCLHAWRALNNTCRPERAVYVGEPRRTRTDGRQNLGRLRQIKSSSPEKPIARQAGVVYHRASLGRKHSSRRVRVLFFGFPAVSSRIPERRTCLRQAAESSESLSAGFPRAEQLTGPRLRK